MIVTVHQAKTQLSKLILAAQAGEEVIIARGATPVVKITALAPLKPKRVFGAHKGEFDLTEGFFEPLPDDELVRWNGEGD